jgi:peptidoglycan/xylan/chitin deacetylase (PgdA/CDA1 family)
MKLTSNPRVPFQLPGERKPLASPGGKSLIVQFVVNVEHWQFDLPMPRVVMTPPHGRAHVPDVPNFSWAEYGNRCGMPRFLKALGDHGIRATASVNASIIEAYPQLAAQIRAAGWEFIGHGTHQRSAGSETSEKENIDLALAMLTRFCDKRPRGWLGPGLSETFDTPDLLRRAGIEYLFEWVIDDLPCWMQTTHGPMLVVPYNLELNDSVVYAVEKQSSPEMLLRVTQTIETFERESAESGQPRVLTLPLHPHLSGVPHRINYLMRIIDMLRARNDTVFMTGSEIADWYMRQDAPPAVEKAAA